jgi:hypothetical protein
MKLSIIREDNAVYVDGLSFSNLDLSFIPSNVHALQWKNDLGWIEFVEDENFIKPQNETIRELPDWANIAVDRWNTEKAIQDRQ